MNAARRRRTAKGRWMKIREGAANPRGKDGKPILGVDGKPTPGLLAQYMDVNDFSQARLGRYAGTSRQFIHMLVTGQKRTCTPEVARRIEEALRVLPGTLFMTKESPQTRPAVKANQTRAVA